MIRGYSSHPESPGKSGITSVKDDKSGDNRITMSVLCRVKKVFSVKSPCNEILIKPLIIVPEK